MTRSFSFISALAVAGTFGTAALADFELSSPDVTDGAAISAAQFANSFGCEGDNAGPTLNWSGAPEGTRGYAVTFYDKDAPTGSGFWHWVVTDIPASATSISPNSIPDGAVQGINDAGITGFIGPCPPIGRTHTYQYTVHALDTDTLGAPEGASGALTGFFLFQHTLETATLNVIAGPRQ
ncbi:YbhB/YbcL family Raf kinase inhibitor-like protein [Rhodobacteraceae bacterium CCMM004]|nr:YbhB/YbcL family Raf kinase inhibitor-like protein [Rhodobacteraceae bacterium CCMM004]